MALKEIHRPWERDVNVSTNEMQDFAKGIYSMKIYKNEGIYTELDFEHFYSGRKQLSKRTFIFSQIEII